MINWWNVWQHYRKQARSGHRADLWALNYVKGFIPEDRLRLYEGQ